MSSKQFPHPFGDLAKEYRSMRRKLPMEVSVIAAAEFKENFRRGGYRSATGVTKWKARKKDKKGSRRAVLIKTGRLRRAVKPAPTYDEARVINDVSYASAHNEGFTGTVRVKSHKRSRYSKNKTGTGVYSTRTRRERQRSVKVLSGSSKVKSHSRKMNVPARPFMITTPPLLNDIEKHVFKKLDKIF